MRIHVLALNGVFDTGLSTVLDTFAVANMLAETAGVPAVRFTVTVTGVRRRVRTAQGFAVPVRLASKLRAPDVVVVPALGALTPPALKSALALAETEDAAAQLVAWSKKGTLTTAACTASFVLARAGLLDNRIATTSWWLAPSFREMFPRVELDESRMVVESGRCVTAGAALGHVDLALWLVRRRSPALAAMVARYLLVDARPSQAPFVIPAHLAHTDPVVERFERWARGSLGERFSLGEAARASGVSQRTLGRRMRLVLGRGPLSYVQDLRVEQAVHRLQTSAASLDDIAAEVGYADGVTLRTLIRRKTGRGVRQLRARPTG